MGIDMVLDKLIKKLGKLESAYLVGDYAKGIDSGIIEIVVIGDDVNNDYLENIKIKISENISSDSKKDKIFRSVNFIINNKVPEGAIILYRKEK